VRQAFFLQILQVWLNKWSSCVLDIRSTMLQMRMASAEDANNHGR